MLKNLIVNEYKVSAFNIDKKLTNAIVSFENGQTFKLYPKLDQDLQQNPTFFIHSNTEKVIILDEFSENYFILTNNNFVKKVKLDSTFSSFVLHTVGGNSISYVVNEKYNQIIFYNEQSVILYNIDSDSISELIFSGIKQVKT